MVLLVGLNLAAALGLIGIWIDGHPADCQSEGCSREIRDARAKAKLFWLASTAVLVITLGSIPLVRR
ncbi:MAG: hypothetical protein ACJ740_00765 [Gaiellales bacterium]